MTEGLTILEEAFAKNDSVAAGLSDRKLRRSRRSVNEVPIHKLHRITLEWV